MLRTVQEGKVFVRERRYVSENARGKGVVWERHDVTDNAMGNVVVRE